MAATTTWAGALEIQLKTALERLENLENQSRRQNAKIIGLTEDTEGKTPVDFFKKWIPDVLNMQSDGIQIERAHHTGQWMKLVSKEDPRAILVRLRNYTDRHRILYATRNKGTIKVDGGNVFLSRFLHEDGEEEEGFSKCLQIAERN